MKLPRAYKRAGQSHVITTAKAQGVIVCVTGAETPGLKDAVSQYDAVIEWVPVDNCEVVKLALPFESCTVAIPFVPSLNASVPRRHSRSRNRCRHRRREGSRARPSSP